MDSDTNNITSIGLGNCLTRDGQGQATANLPMAGFRHTGAGDGVALTDYATLKQVQNSTINWTTAGGTVDAITATYTPAITALVDGMICCIRTTGTNLTTGPTFAPNGLTAHIIVRSGATLINMAPGDMPTEAILRYDSAGTRWRLLNPKPVTTGTIVMTANSAADDGCLLCFGQAVSRTASTTAALFARIGTTYGIGDGTTTFNLPDLRGFSVVAPDSMGGSAANRLTTATRGGGWATPNLNGGGETVTLNATQIPAHTHAQQGTLTSTGASVGHTHNMAYGTNNVTAFGGANPVLVTLGSGGSTATSGAQSVDHTHQTTLSGNTDNGTGGGLAHTSVQPTLTMNFQIVL